MTYLKTTMLSVLMIMTSSVAVYAKDVSDEWRRLSQESAQLQRIGKYSQSTDLNKKLLEMADQNGYDSQEVINILKELSEFYMIEGDIVQSHNYSMRRLELAQQNLVKQPHHIENLIFVAANQRKKSLEAENYYQRVLDLVEIEKGKNSIELVDVFCGLISIYQYKSDFKKANMYIEKSLRLIDAEAKKNPSLAFKKLMLIEQANIPSHDDVLEKYIKSVEVKIHKKAEEIYKIIPNPNLFEYQKFASILLFQNRISEAEEVYQKAIVLVEKNQDKGLSERLNVLSTLSGAAELMKKKEKYHDAGVQYEKIAKMLEEHFGDDHPILLTALVNLTECYQKQQKMDQAKILLDRVLKIAEQGSKFGNVHAMGAQSKIVKLSLNQGDENQVEDVNRKVFDMLKSFAEGTPNGFTTLMLPQEIDEK